LDLGCGHQFLPDWAWIPDVELLNGLPQVVGADYDFQSLKQHKLLKAPVRSDIGCLPFQNDSFDLVTANMVMEHVLDPVRVLQEARRVLAPGGVFLVHTPNRSSPMMTLAAHIPQTPKNWLVGMLEDRQEEDVYPTVYRFNRVSEIHAAARQAGFEVESCEFVVSEAFTQVLGPLSIFELLYIRITQAARFAHLRPDLIVVLRMSGKHEFAGEPVGRLQEQAIAESERGVRNVRC
jgi:SAM-dependent methyltransferase